MLNVFYFNISRCFINSLKFQIKFAQIILDLETVNKLLESYMSSIHLHYNALIPHLSNPTPMDRPEIFRKTCNVCFKNLFLIKEYVLDIFGSFLL